MKVIIENSPKSTFSQNATFFVAGGLGGLGRSIIGWMVDRGARNFLIPSRSGPRESANSFLQDMQDRNVNLQIASCDISDLESLQETLKTYGASMPPIKGCIQAASSLQVFIQASLF